MSAWSAAELAGTRLPEEWYKHSAGLAPAPGQDKVLLMFVGAEGAKYGDIIILTTLQVVFKPLSRVADEMSDDEIAQGVGSLLTAARGEAVPGPDSVMRHPWTTDPHFLVDNLTKNIFHH